MKRTALIVIAMLGVLFGYTAAHAQSYQTLLDRPEQQAMAQTIQYALEYNKTNQPAAWANPDTGNSGTLVPLQTMQDPNGRTCREFVATLTVDNVEWQGQGTACRQPDGQWLVTPGEAVDYRPLTRNDYAAYPYGTLDWYDSYPYYVWGSYPPIYFSYSVGRLGGPHHFRDGDFYGGFRDHRDGWMMGGGHHRDWWRTGRRHRPEEARHRPDGAYRRQHEVALSHESTLMARKSSDRPLPRSLTPPQPLSHLRGSLVRPDTITREHRGMVDLFRPHFGDRRMPAGTRIRGPERNRGILQYLHHEPSRTRRPQVIDHQAQRNDRFDGGIRFDRLRKNGHR